jgi:hypothetical protein
MKIRLIGLMAICVPICLNAGNQPGVPLAVYYSFDTPPSAALVTEMQAEVARILAEGGVRVAWRALGSPRNGEDFQGIAVFQFRGVCSFDRYPVVNEHKAEWSGQPLAKTDVTNGQVLPFGAVDCDRLRRFVAPVLKSLRPEEMNSRLGQAIARVTSHEIYHMLTASVRHARQGIARASHSRAELTAPRFAFAPQETNWLRAWAGNASSQPVAEAGGLQTDPPEPESTPPESVSSAGR